MLPALWVAKTGLSAQDMNLTTISNNLANVSTTGFKRDRADFEDLLYQIRRQPGGQSSQDSELPTGLQLGTGVRIAGTQKIFTAGSLQIDGLGQLRTGNGLPVLGNGGPIAVPPEQKVEIGQDGTISIRALGEAPNVMAEVDRIKLVNPDPKSLTKGTDGLIRVKDAAGPQEVDANVRVTSGFLESSNVNAVEEMTAILSLSRQFELHVKMMRTAEDGASAMARVMQIS